MTTHEKILDLHLLEEKKQITFQPAPIFKRVLNLVIDYLTIIHFSILVGFLLGIFFTIIGKPELAIGNTSIFKNNTFRMTISLSIIFLYYAISEYNFSGKTLGKFATQTTVKNINGNLPSFQDILIRSLCRLIPFDLITFLLGKNMGWHDYFSKTIVVED